MPVTMREVALAANVSIQTVSNVVNERPIVADDTRLRVLSTMQRLGYQPNALAQSLRANRAQTIGLVFARSERRTFVRKPYLNELLSGFADATRDTDYSLLMHSGAENDPAPAILQLYQRRRIDAVILVGVLQADPVIEQVVASAVPTVVIDLPVEGDDVAGVRADYRAGAAAAVRYLIERGHTAIGYLGGTLDVYSGLERRLGYWETMTAHGLRSVEVSGGWSREDGCLGMMHLLEQHPNLTAVFAAADPMAVGALEAARAAGRHVPDDLAVVGFNDLDLASLVTPALTTVHVPVYELGIRAAELLLDRLSTGHFTDTDIILPTHLVIRRSA